MGQRKRLSQAAMAINEEREMKSRKNICRAMIICLSLFIVHCSLFICCDDHGQIGGADVTGTYYPGDRIFDERLGFLSGLWNSRDPGIGLLDSYRIRKWGDLTDKDKVKARALFSGLNIDEPDNPKTWSTKNTPQAGDYILLFDDTVYGQEDADSGNNENWGFCFMGVVRAINIFNNDKKRGAVIIEYLEGADPAWLSDPDGYAYQGLKPGEKPFFGIYFKALDKNTVQMANAVDLAAMNAGKLYYTEKGTLQEAVKFFDVENEAEFISWGVVIPHSKANE
jgi:hypothetical protein